RLSAHRRGPARYRNRARRAAALRFSCFGPPDIGAHNLEIQRPLDGVIPPLLMTPPGAEHRAPVDDPPDMILHTPNLERRAGANPSGKLTAPFNIDREAFAGRRLGQDDEITARHPSALSSFASRPRRAARSDSALARAVTMRSS